MEKHKNIIITILFVIAILYGYEKYKNYLISNKYSQLELEYNKLDNNFRMTQDKEGFYRGIAESAETNITILKKVYEEELKELRKEFTNLTRNYNNLRGLFTLSTRTVNEISVKLDSLREEKYYYDLAGNVRNIKYSRNFTYSDKWSDFTGNIETNTVLVDLDKITFNYSIKDSLTFVSYYKKDKVFGKKQLFIEGKSYNPHTMITGIREVNINNTYIPKWSVGLQSGYGFTQHGMGWYLGLGVSKTLIRW
jgi:hypothetical protein